MTGPGDVATGDGHAPRPSRTLELAFAAVALVLCITYVVLSTQIELRRESAGGMDARTWPLVLGVSGIAASIALSAIALTRSPANRDELDHVAAGGPLRVVLTLALSAGFVAVWSVSPLVAFGYRIELFPFACGLYLAALLVLYGLRRWVGLVLYPVLLTAFIFIVFGVLLRIPL